MTQLKHIAIVSETTKVSFSDVALASAALQKQVLRDFTPIWNESATVDAFPKLEDVPLGSWAVIIRDDIGFPGAAGIHLDNEGQPFALVQFGTTWQLTTSHEILEMLADPFGNRLASGDSIKPGQGKVQYLVEVCDPSEDFQFGYRVNGIRLSDFYTTNFFDPMKKSNTQYSFTEAIKEPRQVLKGGYLSWFDPISNHWWQARFFGSKITFVDLGVITAANGDFRSAIELQTVVEEKINGLPAGDPRLKTVKAPLMAAMTASSSKADSWHLQIDALKAQYAP
ncbi:MAG: hypothetical protein ACR2MG_07990 [Pyrinomonadaceae bacterium]